MQPPKYKIEDYKAIAEKNGGKCLTNELVNGKVKLHLICSEKHEWHTFPHNLIRGFWCKKCASKRIASQTKKTIDDCNDKASLNQGKCLSNTYINAGSKMTWQCKVGHIWKASYNSIKRGSWCNICSSQRTAEKLKLSINDCINSAKNKKGHCLSESYVNTQTKMSWQCDKGHIWETTYGNIRNGSWCKICSQKKEGINRRTSIDYFKEYAISKNGICLSNVYENQNTKLEFRCHKEHIWETTAGSIKAGKTWCPICAGNYKVKTVMQIEEKLDEIREIAISKNGKCLSTTYINSKLKLKFQCSEGHIWETIPLLIKNGAWCNKCAVTKVSDSQRDSLDEYIEIIKLKRGKCISQDYISQQISRIHVECEFGHKWFARPQGLKKGTWCRKCYGTAKPTLDEIKVLAESRGGNCLSDEYINDMTKLKWQCSEKHIWEATPNNIKHGRWCPNCSTGIGERICRLSFEKIFKTHFNTIRPDWLKNSLGNKMELDGYNEKLKVAFEHQGRQHYSKTNVNRYYLKSTTILNDKEKAEICKKMGIKIIYIPELFTDTKLGDLIPFIINELQKKNINYPEEAINIKLDPIETYTYTKTKELIERENRAKAVIEEESASLLKIYRNNSGVRLQVMCQNKHIASTTISQILKRNICIKCNL